MNIKNTAVDVATMGARVSNTRNRVGSVITIIFSIIFLIVAIIAFFFSWIAGVIFLVLALIFFGLHKFTQYATKVNEETIEKLQSMKESIPDEEVL